MDGKYVFWYCGTHDDGCIVYYSPEVIKTLNEDQIFNPPEYLNLCCVSIVPINKVERYCVYHMKGIFEYKDGKTKVISPIQFSYEREGGGFKFEYYYKNVYDFENKYFIELDKMSDANKKLLENILKKNKKNITVE